MRILRAVIVAVAAIAGLAGGVPVRADTPVHEDPRSTAQIFDGVSVLRKYSTTLDLVQLNDSAGVDYLVQQVPWANIPPSLTDSVSGFISSGRSIAQLISDIQSDLDRTRVLLAQYRPEEARQSAETLRPKLDKASSGLIVMENALENTGAWWQVSSFDPHERIRVEYRGVQTKLGELRQRLDILIQVRISLENQADVLIAASTGNPSGGSQLVLTPTDVTLAVNPESAFVGDTVEFTGTLTAGGKPLDGKQVTVLLMGSPVQVVQTDKDGVFNGQITLPYRYLSPMTAQAIYYPLGADIGLYLGCSSAEVSIQVLFYDAKLTIQVPERSYPGQTFAVKGKLDYGVDPVPDNRQIEVYWDSTLVSSLPASGEFEVKLTVPDSAQSGQHQVSLYLPSQQRYAPSEAGAQIEIVKASVVIDVQKGRFLVLPLSLSVHGKVHSEVGPVSGATLKITLGTWQTTTVTGTDGSFNVRLGTGVSTMLLGSQPLTVEASPLEVWNAPGSSVSKMVVVNSVNIGGLFIVLGALGLFSVRRFKRRPGIARTQTEPDEAPVLIVAEKPPVPAVKLRTEPVGTPRTILCSIYMELARLVQSVTSTALRRDQTLREYDRECGPKLGALSRYFHELTMMVERTLYSKHSPGDAELAESKELGQKLKEGIKGENT